MTTTTRVHDLGFVRYVDHMGDDGAVVQAARVSYAKGTQTVRSDRRLLDYLMRHGHVSPFEMCQLKLHVKMPIFVARQFMRHSWHVNEISGRYSELKMEAYVPEEVRGQSTKNKQGSEGHVDLVGQYAQDARDFVKLSYASSFVDYEELLAAGTARELARCVTSVATYTEVVVSGNLRNILFFLKARLDEHAQQEIRDYAEAIRNIVAEHFPETWAAFEEHFIYAVKFSRSEMSIVRDLVENGGGWETAVAMCAAAGVRPRQRAEFLKKLEAK